MEQLLNFHFRYVFMDIHMCTEAKVDITCLPQLLSTLFFETESLTESRAHQPARLTRANKFQGPFCLHLSSTRITRACPPRYVQGWLGGCVRACVHACVRVCGVCARVQV